MIHTQYRYEIKARGRTLHIRLLGEIDHHSAVSLREDLDKLLYAERPERLLLDLSHIEFMDSAGLGLLMGRLRLMKELGGRLVLSHPNARVMKILRLSGMERFMEIDDGAKGEKK